MIRKLIYQINKQDNMRAVSITKGTKDNFRVSRWDWDMAVDRVIMKFPKENTFK